MGWVLGQRWPEGGQRHEGGKSGGAVELGNKIIDQMGGQPKARRVNRKTGRSMGRCDWGGREKGGEHRLWAERMETVDGLGPLFGLVWFGPLGSRLYFAVIICTNSS